MQIKEYTITKGVKKILTDWQQERFDEFEKVIHKRQMLLRNGKYRGTGKTYLLNELGFTLQVLGYKVLVYTPFKKMEYFAENFIYSSDNLREIDNKLKTVILFDEVEVFSDEAQELIKIFKQLRIPVVGFVRYKDEEKPTPFKMEYECKWI